MLPAAALALSRITEGIDSGIARTVENFKAETDSDTSDRIP